MKIGKQHGKTLTELPTDHFFQFTGNEFKFHNFSEAKEYKTFAVYGT